MAIMIDIRAITLLMLPVLVGLLFYFRKKQKRNIGFLFCFSVFYVYLLYVAQATIFPLRLFDSYYIQVMREGHTWASGINLIPFREVSIEYFLSRQGIGNVLLTVPFGLGLPFIATTGLRSIAWRGLLFTVSIELVQLLIDIIYGFGWRKVDINDILFNFLGTMIGFGLFSGIVWLYRKIPLEKEPVDGVWEHMHAVLTRQ